MTTRPTPWVDLVLTEYGTSASIGIGALTTVHVIGDVVLTEGAPPSDRTAVVPDASKLTATLFIPDRASAGGRIVLPKLEPGATVELRLNNSSVPRWRGELISVDWDDVGRVRCEWQSPIRRLIAARGADIPAGADARTPRQMLDALVAAAGMPANSVTGQGQAGRSQRITIPQGRTGLEQICDFGGAEVLDESWRSDPARVRLRALSANVRQQNRRVTDLPESAGPLSAILVPPAREHRDPWGVINRASLDLTVSALQGFQLRLGSGEDSQISLTDLSLGTHTHEITDSLGARGTTSDGQPVSVTISGSVSAAETEVVGSPADVVIPAVEVVLQVDPDEAVLVDREYSFHASRAASVARYGLRERERPLRMALTVTGRSWAEMDAATPALAGSALAALPTDAAQQAYLDILSGALRDTPVTVYRLDHDTTQGAWAAAQLLARRVGWRERLSLAAERGDLHVHRVCALETRFRRDGWASQRAWYMRA